MYETGRDLTPRRDAAAHLAWLAGQPAFRAAVTYRGDLDPDMPRRVSLPWRELGPDVRPEFAAARAGRYDTALRKLARDVLPPKLACFIDVLARHDHPPIENLESSSLSQSEEQELRRIVSARLTTDVTAANRRPAIPDTDRKRRQRLLARIDPTGQPRLLLPAARGLEPKPGDFAAVSATQAARGNFTAHASSYGYPGVGRVIDTDTEGLRVLPLDVPPDPPEPRDAGPFSYGR